MVFWENAVHSAKYHPASDILFDLKKAVSIEVKWQENDPVMDLDWLEDDSEVEDVIIVGDGMHFVDEAYCKTEGLTAAEVTETFHSLIRHM